MSALVIYDGLNPESMLYAGLAAYELKATLWDYTRYLKLPELSRYDTIKSFGVDFMSEDVSALEIFATDHVATYCVYESQESGGCYGGGRQHWRSSGILSDIIVGEIPLVLAPLGLAINPRFETISIAVERWTHLSSNNPCTVHDLNIVSMLLDADSQLDKPLAMAEWVVGQCASGAKPVWETNISHYRKRLARTREICERTLSTGELAGRDTRLVSSGFDYFSDVMRALGHLGVHFINANQVNEGTLLTIWDAFGDHKPATYLENDDVKKSFASKDIRVIYSWSSPLGIHLIVNNRFA